MSRSPFRRYGGKSKLARQIASLIPAHRVYVEPFCGAAHVLFSKETSAVEVIADRDPHLIDLWQRAANPAAVAEVAEMLGRMPNTKAHYENCRQLFPACADPVERAAAYYVLTQRSINGAFGVGWSRPSRPSDVQADANRITRLRQAHGRLAGVRIECSDFRDLLPRFDSADVFLMCDPPYPHETRRAKVRYQHEMTDFDHAALLDLLQRHEGTALLCGYACPLYDEVLRGWTRLDYRLPKHAASGTIKPTAVESVWLNPRCWAAVAEKLPTSFALPVAA